MVPPHHYCALRLANVPLEPCPCRPLICDAEGLAEHLCARGEQHYIVHVGKQADQYVFATGRCDEDTAACLLQSFVESKKGRCKKRRRQSPSLRQTREDSPEAAKRRREAIKTTFEMPLNPFEATLQCLLKGLQKALENKHLNDF